MQLLLSISLELGLITDSIDLTDEDSGCSGCLEQMMLVRSFNGLSCIISRSARNCETIEGDCDRAPIRLLVDSSPNSNSD